MKILMAEDDFTSRKILQIILEKYGDVDIAADGAEAVKAFKYAMAENEPYDFVCLDIMMPKKSGQQTLKEIRKIEKDQGILEGDGAKIIMTTAIDDSNNVMTAFREMADGYLVKPITATAINNKLRELELI
ncbi:MAG: response regulator transcription factor [Candidatus Marinimicrobia bacterium]|nr:response regulator transcription factor [Candidatus Neomarinimicrobiota bacterium]